MLNHFGIVILGLWCNINFVYLATCYVNSFMLIMMSYLGLA